MSIEPPIPKGSINPVLERNQTLYTLSLTYELKTSNLTSLYKVYDDYFSSIGWADPMKELFMNQEHHQKPWSSYRMSFNADGNPEAHYGSTWKSKNIPAHANVQVLISSFENNIFTARIKISIAPQINMEVLVELQELMLGDPKNVFDLHESLGFNPFEIDKVIASGYKIDKSNSIAKEYSDILEKVLSEYKKFGEKYIKSKIE